MCIFSIVLRNWQINCSLIQQHIGVLYNISVILQRVIHYELLCTFSQFYFNDNISAKIVTSLQVWKSLMFSHAILAVLFGWSTSRLIGSWKFRARVKYLSARLCKFSYTFNQFWIWQKTIAVTKFNKSNHNLILLKNLAKMNMIEVRLAKFLFYIPISMTLYFGLRQPRKY